MNIKILGGYKITMTTEQYNKAGAIIEQIKIAKKLKDRIQKDYDNYKDTDKHLLETLNKCNEAVTVLIEIDEGKFKAL